MMCSKERVHEESDRPTITEFKDLSEDVTKFLEEKMSYKQGRPGFLGIRYTGAF